MAALKRIKSKLFQTAFGRNYDSSGVHEVAFFDLIYFLWKRAGWQFLRGLFHKPRFRKSGGRFLIGRNTNILFHKYISIGQDVSIGDFSHVNGYSQEGIHLGDHVHIREFAWIQATSELDNPGKGLTILHHTYIGPRCYMGAGGRNSHWGSHNHWIGRTLTGRESSV